MPVFLLMAAGYLMRLAGLIDLNFAGYMNRFVFQVALPLMLFRQIATAHFLDVWDTKFFLFCFLSTIAAVVLCALISLFAVKKHERGEFIQASYRASQALLATVYIANMYGESGTTVPIMIIGSVPLYNVLAVMALTLFPGTESGEAAGTGDAKVDAASNGASKAGKSGDGKNAKLGAAADKSGDGKNAKSGGIDCALVLKIAKGIITNPLILFIMFGIVWSLLGLPTGGIPDKTLSSITQLATPMGLLGMGATLDPKKVSGELKNALIATFLKLVGLVAVFLPIAAALGFRNEQLATILVMLGAPTTVSSYVMARNMGHEGTLTSNTVVLTTLLSAFTLTFWIWLLRTIGLI